MPWGPKATQPIFPERNAVIATYDLANRFTYHAPTAEQIDVYQMIRNIAHSYASYLNDVCPDGREKSLAMTKLEEVVFWANAAIARTTGE